MGVRHLRCRTNPNRYEGAIMTPDSVYRSGSGYVITESIREKMRQSSAQRWKDKSQRDHLSRLRTITIPIDTMRSLYAEGWSMRRIGALFGVKADTICRRMREYGISPRSKGITGHHWNEEHHNWKGDEAGYQALHSRLHRRRGMPRHCEVCDTSNPSKTYDWANLTGRYEDIEDYKRMCRSCHRKYDAQRRRNG